MPQLGWQTPLKVQEMVPSGALDEEGKNPSAQVKHLSSPSDKQVPHEEEQVSAEQIRVPSVWEVPSVGVPAAQV